MGARVHCAEARHQLLRCLRLGLQQRWRTGHQRTDQEVTGGPAEELIATQAKLFRSPNRSRPSGDPSIVSPYRLAHGTPPTPPPPPRARRPAVVLLCGGILNAWPVSP